jgi:hypothetical protein
VCASIASQWECVQDNSSSSTPGQWHGPRYTSRLAPKSGGFALLHDENLQHRAAIIAGMRSGGHSAGTTASSRMLETLQLAHSCLAGRTQTPALASLLFYIDCEAFSTLGRPVTELPWTRVLSAPTAWVFDTLEVRVVTQWLARHTPDFVLTAEVPDGTRWLSGVEVKVIRHAVDEFCAFDEREIRFVDRVRERASGTTAAHEGSPNQPFDWEDVDRFLADTRDWLGTVDVPDGPAPADGLSEAEERAFHRETLMSISSTE